MSLLKINPEKIQGIFITHEHTDHIKGAEILSRKFNIPIYATKGTIKNSTLDLSENLIHPIKNSEILNIAGLEVRAYKKSHDASDPIFFQIINDKVISIITDAGKACNNISQAVSESDLLLIESNHDVEMLKKGPYPFYLKQRILSDRGHLSNLQSALCVLEYSNRKLKNLILAHLSKTNNHPRIAKQTYERLLKERNDLSPNLSISTNDFAMPLIQVV